MQINNGQKTLIARLTKVLGGILFCAQLHNPGQTFGATAPAGQSVTLVWNVNTDPNVTGCNVYYGVSSGNYTSVVNAGNVTNTTVSGLVAGVTYYFAATTYDAAGDQSGYSTEIAYTATTATQDLIAWTVIGTATLGVSGSLDFTDTNAANFSKRFYRTQQMN